jgi:hypothetical protein
MRQTFAAYANGHEVGISLKIRYGRVYEPYGADRALLAALSSLAAAGRLGGFPGQA